MKPLILVLLNVFVIYNISSGLSDYLNTIPNGNYVYTAQNSKCQICHEFYTPTVSQSQLNQFGTDYRNCGKSWGACLGQKDSDGDGFTNEVELNCSNYSWAAYSGPCGSNFDKARNPGDANVTPTIKVEDPAEPALDVAPSLLAQPNPFNPSTTLRFRALQNAPVALVILSPEGRVVRNFVLTGKSKNSGEVIWNGTDSENRAVSTGVYVAQLISGGKTLTAKLVLAR